MNRKHARGLTLLELVVVLSILAIVTSIAVASFSAVEDQSRLDASALQLEQLEFAVLGEQGLRTPDNQVLVNGFVADMGRLPVLVDHDSNAATPVQALELWTPPAGVAAYLLRRAEFTTDATNNITSVMDWNGTIFVSNTPSTSYQDLQVYLPTGWRGPYVRKQIAADVIRDGWGNPLIPLKPDGTDAAAGDSLAILRTFGSNGLSGGSTLNEADRDVVFRSTLVDRSLASIAVTLDSTVTATEIRLYLPDEATGRIRVLKHAVSSGTYPFNNLPIGPKVLRAYNGSTPATKPYSVVLTSGGIPLLELE